jgi:hypothetical protein
MIDLNKPEVFEQRTIRHVNALFVDLTVLTMLGLPFRDVRYRTIVHHSKKTDGPQTNQSASRARKRRRALLAGWMPVVARLMSDNNIVHSDPAHVAYYLILDRVITRNDEEN